MTGPELREIAERLFRRHGWQVDLAAVLGVNVSTLRRYAAGAAPIPGPVVAALILLSGYQLEHDSEDWANLRHDLALAHKPSP